MYVAVGDHRCCTIVDNDAAPLHARVQTFRLSHRGDGRNFQESARAQFEAVKERTLYTALLSWMLQLVIVAVP